jgi:hypothetical protein
MTKLAEHQDVTPEVSHSYYKGAGVKLFLKEVKAEKKSTPVLLVY